MNLAAAFIMFSWPLTEVYIALTRRSRAGSDRTFKGGGAAIIWLVAIPGSLAAVATYFLRVWAFPITGEWLVLASSLVVLAGAAFRLNAIRTLGTMFTVDVAVREEHRLVCCGPYRLLRHPAYTGLLISFLGVGLASGSWLGLLLAVAPVTAVLIRRIRVEERALGDQFGDSYREYQEQTKRLIPGVY